jgi:tape measure domain-containing protein
MATRAITLTLSVRDADTVRRELERIGPAGEEAIRRLDAAAQRAAGGQGGLRGVQGAAQAAEGAMGNLASRAGLAGQALSGFGTAGLAAAAGLGALGVGLSTVARAGDDMVASLGRIRAATGSIEAARDVYDQLFKLSLQTGQAVSDSAGQFARFAIASKEIGATNVQAVKLVETMQKAAIVGGASAQEASATAMQLGQALASGVLQGEELRSILENMPNLASALATQLGVGIGQLRQMGSEGKLTADVVMPALLRASEEINRQYEQMPVTMSRAFDQLTVAAGGFAAQLDDALGISQNISKSLQEAARLFNLLRGELPTVASRAADRGQELQDRVDYLRGQVARNSNTGPSMSNPTGGYQRRAQIVGAQNAGVDLLAQQREELAAAEKELRDHQDDLRSVERDGREDREADRTEAANRLALNRQQRSARETTELRTKLDKEFAAQQDHQRRVAEINRLVAVGPRAGGLSTAEGERLTAAATRERDEALKKLNETGRSGNRVRNEELELVSSIVREQGRAAEQYEDQQNRIFDNAQRTIDANDEQLRLMETEAGLLGQNADVRERELAIIKERRRITQAGIKDEEQIAKLLEQTGDLYDRQLALTQRKNSFNELARVGEQAFDRIGSAITTAFADGSMKAIDFGNIAKSVLSEIAQAALRMAVVNPVLNSMFGGSRGTVSGLMGSTALTQGTGGNGSSGGLGGYTDVGSGIAKLAGGSLGFGGTNLAGGDYSTGFSWLDGTLNTELYTIGLGTQTAATSTALSGLGAGVYGPATPASVAAAGGAVGGSTSMSLGTGAAGALGVAGGLYGIYSGAQQGGAKGWATGASGAFGTLAGASTLAGGSAALGSASAGLLGGAGGAVLGTLAAAAPYIAVVLAIASMFLPGQKPSDMTGVYLGNLHHGTSEVTGLSGDRYSQENRDQATQIGEQIGSLGESLKNALGVSEIPFNYSISVGARDGLVAGYGGRTHDYVADEAGSQAMIKDITAAIIESMRGLASAEVQSIIERSGGDTEALLGNLDWYNGTYKAMIAESENPVSQFQASITALVTPIDETINKARELGLSEDKLNEVRQKGIDALYEQRTAALRDIAASDTQRQATAAGVNNLTLALSGWYDAAQAETDALFEQLKQLGLGWEEMSPILATRWSTLSAERGAAEAQLYTARAGSDNGLWDRLDAANGGSETLEGALTGFDRRAALEYFQAQRDGMTDLTLLARVQAEERLAVERTYAEQAAALAEQRQAAEQQELLSAQQSVAGVITSLTEYGRSLRYGETSTLSYRDQYNASADDFRSASAGALAGDWQSIQQVQALSQQFLQSSQAINGSGWSYAADMNEVRDVLAGIAGLGADRLTDSARTVNAIGDLNRDLGDLLRELISTVRQGNDKPARLAA